MDAGRTAGLVPLAGHLQGMAMENQRRADEVARRALLPDQGSMRQGTARRPRRATSRSSRTRARMHKKGSGPRCEAVRSSEASTDWKPRPELILSWMRQDDSTPLRVQRRRQEVREHARRHSGAGCCCSVRADPGLPPYGAGEIREESGDCKYGKGGRGEER